MRNHSADETKEGRGGRGALLLAEAQWRMLFEYGPNACYLHDLRGVFVDGNRAAEALIQFRKEEIIGKSFLELELLAPPDLVKAGELLARSARGEATGPDELNLRAKDGSQVVVEICTYPVQILDQVLVLGVAHDITSRKKMEASLREAEDRYRTLFEQSPDGIVIIDPETTLPLEFNTVAHRQLGYTREEYARLRICDYEAVETVAEIQQRIQRIRSQGRERFETVHRTKSGEPRQVEVTAQHLSMGGRTVFHTIFRDITEQVRAKKAEQEALALLKKAQEVARLGSWSSSLSGDASLAWSSEVHRIFGVPEAHFSGRVQDFYACIHPEDLAKVKMAKQAALEQGAPYELDHRIVCPDGRVRWVHQKAEVIRNAQGQPVRMLGVVQDITVRKKAEAELRKSRERYRQVFESVNDAIFLRPIPPGKFDTNFIEVNGVACKRLGYTRSELLQKSPVDIDPNVNLEQIRQRVDQFPTGEGFIFETVHLTKEGRPIPVEISARKVVWDDQLMILSVARDLTERKSAEIVLRESERRFRAVVESGPMGIFVGHNGRFVYVNGLAAKLLGADSPEQLAGLPVLDRVHPDYRALAWERIRLLDEERKAVPLVDMKCLRLDGSSFDVEIVAVPFLYADRPGALVFFQDITGRKQLEAQLRQAVKMEAVGQLAGGVAHDFNNVVSAVLMHLGLLQQLQELPLSIRESLKEVENETMRAASLTRQLLVFSRREAARFEPLDLNPLVSNLLKMLQRLLGENISVHFQSAPGGVWVNADAGMLEQVITNLCINSRDAMPQGGRLQVSTRMVEFKIQPDVANPNARPGCFACLSVTDTGCGIDERILGRIFEPFFTTKEAGQGTGLGLAIVYGIVNQHHGWVEVKSKVGQGSSFQVYLPALKKEYWPTAEEKAPEPIRGGSETILLVEDELGLRRSAALCLRKLGYAVLEASDGTEALKLWSQHPQCIALLLTDQVMPAAMTGLQLAERLRLDRPGLKVILSSGYSHALDQLQPAAGENFVFLAKPYTSTTLAKLVRQCLDEPPPAPSARPEP